MQESCASLSAPPHLILNLRCPGEKKLLEQVFDGASLSMPHIVVPVPSATFLPRNPRNPNLQKSRRLSQVSESHTHISTPSATLPSLPSLQQAGRAEGHPSENNLNCLILGLSKVI